jgi:hypothetical protein
VNPISEVLKRMGWDEKLRELAVRVDRNVPRHGDPERFHIEKSEIANELKNMAKVKSP